MIRFFSSTMQWFSGLFNRINDESVIWSYMSVISVSFGRFTDGSMNASDLPVLSGVFSQAPTVQAKPHDVRPPPSPFRKGSHDLQLKHVVCVWVHMGVDSLVGSSGSSQPQAQMLSEADPCGGELDDDGASVLTPPSGEVLSDGEPDVKRCRKADVPEAESGDEDRRRQRHL
jgi:hypothetical protein